MLRILHSLPRTHKLLLLPVATMVTVLGAQKIVTTYQDVQREHQTLDTVIVPLEADAHPGLPSLSFQRSPVGDAIERASQALDATRTHVPLAKLTASEVLDLELIESASASAAADAQVPLALARPAESETAAPSAERLDLDQGAIHMAVVVGTIGSGMLDHDGSLVADATSYEEIPDEELVLFDEGPIVLEKEIAATEPFVPEWETYTVQRGDTFAVMAQNRLGLGYREVLRLLDEMPDQSALTRWRAGNSFEYKLDEDGRLLALRMMRNARTGFLVERDEDGFEVASIKRAGEATQRLFAGTVSGSFARSAQATGLSSAEVTQLTSVLGKKLDFRRDTRRGDRFQVLVESDVVDGSSFDPRVLAVKYEGERLDLTLVRNSADNNFYTPDGESLDPAFERHPFEGNYRMSSAFNPRRKHPVTGRVSPHRGTDWAMPIGTPIIAPADGRVEKVANHPVAGRYVVIRHDNGYQTRYLHLSRPLVSRGDRVEMGERIALSGNTGRSTGPHLHYEVLVNNSQVNPMTVDLPENKSLTGERLMAFQRQAEPLLAALESGETGPVVAQSRRDESDDEG
ncbi:peptidoglycan DD-metalloendopeptidase family protein [Halomonas sp. BM-2019]|uniref:peptidoglycan DD-metalloendopeptidase family protein n=1 Tax=Halomonas sp. BM-2019 TaxID=2811227 RepID=UPI001B3C3603|nr:MAG: peptidoglycan DD-metalloendopeptidase family protein [Halomonas sp. BM-2019]